MSNDEAPKAPPQPSPPPADVGQWDLSAKGRYRVRWERLLPNGQRVEAREVAFDDLALAKAEAEKLRNENCEVRIFDGRTGEEIT